LTSITNHQLPFPQPFSEEARGVGDLHEKEEEEEADGRCAFGSTKWVAQ
jgi:hypothetical protein